MKPYFPHQHGALMIEVLVAMLFLAVGLLALAGLQRASTNAFSNSRKRAEATMAANDLAERIRAHPAQADAGMFDDAVRADDKPGLDTHLERAADRNHPWRIQLAWDEPAAYSERANVSSSCHNAAATVSRATGGPSSSSRVARSCMAMEFMP